MCGFLGEFCFDKGRVSDKENFKGLLSLSAHRGPDNTSTFRQGNFQLGFNRLAILDLSEKGNQPKASPSLRYHIVFNGEIYNYKELLAKYNLRGLQSNSDTEVLICLLDVLGVEKTIKELEGMFAIMIVDNLKKKVYLARDFAGIKPLFYGVSDLGIVAASQFDQIFKHSWFNKTLKFNKSVVKEYFGFGYMQAPNTIYNSVFQVEPGELVCCTSEGKLEKLQITSFNSNKLDCSESDKGIENVFSKLITDEVSKQLVSDVPIASFLSGGIDSPIITSLAHKKNKSIIAYTVKVDNKEFDESEKAKKYAQHLGVKQEVINLSTEDLISVIDKHFKYFPEPFGDYSSIPTFGITQLARKEHTVMLSGDGGDELFFGYPRMQHIVENKNWFKIPFIIRKPIISLAIKVGLLKTYAPYSYKNIYDWAMGKQLKIPDKILNKFLKNTSFTKEMITLYTCAKNNFKNENIFNWLRKNEFYGHLQRVLIKVDRASMGNSLEVRIPFLGKKIVEKAFQMSPNYTDKFELKHVLKKIIRNIYPKEIVTSEKKGFSVPIEDWLRNELEEDLVYHIFKLDFYGDEILNVEAIKTYVQDFIEMKHNNGWGVWQIYAWQKWAYMHDLKE